MTASRAAAIALVLALAWPGASTAPTVVVAPTAESPCSTPDRDAIALRCGRAPLDLGAVSVLDLRPLELRPRAAQRRYDDERLSLQRAVTAVPEPAPTALIGIALTALASRRRVR